MLESPTARCASVLIGLALAGTIGVWGYIGIVPLLTGLVRICPAYSLFGFSTCPIDGKSESARQ